MTERKEKQVVCEVRSSAEGIIGCFICRFMVDYGHELDLRP